MLQLLPNSYVLLQDQEDKDDCRLNHTILPIGRNYLSFGIASVGQRLSNGTLCSFTLSYRAKVGNNRVQRHSKTSSCTGKCLGYTRHDVMEISFQLVEGVREMSAE